jgi:hypothetical protein
LKPRFEKSIMRESNSSEDKILQAQAAFAENDTLASIQVRLFGCFYISFVLTLKVHKQKIFDPSRYCEDPPLKKIDYFQTSLKCAMNGTISTSLVCDR